MPFSEGPNSPANATNNTSIGSTAWTDVSNALASDNSYALHTANTTSQYLLCTDFGFTVPADGTVITGIVVDIERWRNSASGNVTDNSLRLFQAGNPVGDNKASAASWPTSDPNSYASYGSAGDTWGLSLTGADVKSTTFGVGLSAVGTSFGGGAVDHIRMTVHWTDDEVSPYMGQLPLSLPQRKRRRQTSTELRLGYFDPTIYGPFPEGAIVVRDRRIIRWATSTSRRVSVSMASGSRNASWIPSPASIAAR